MDTQPRFVIIPILIDAVVLAVAAALLYLVVRFAVRDGLRAHQRRLDRREHLPPPPPES